MVSNNRGKGWLKAILSFFTKPRNLLLLAIVAFAIMFFDRIKKYLEKLFNIGDDALDTAKDLANKVGLGKSDGEKQYDQLSKEPEGYWNPRYVSSAPSGAHVLTYSTKKDFSKRLYDSWGFFAKDFETTLGIFHQLEYKSQVSDLCAQFYEDYKKDLLAYLRPATWTLAFRNYPSSDQFLQISNYTNNLKNF